MGNFLQLRTGVPYEKDGKLFIDVISRTALSDVKGVPYMVAPVNTSGVLEYEAVTPATLAVNLYVGCPQENDYAIGEVIPLQIGGRGQCLVDGTTDVAIGDYLEVLNTAGSAVKDGTTRSVNCFCMAAEDQTSATPTLIEVLFLGLPVQVAAA